MATEIPEDCDQLLSQIFETCRDAEIPEVLLCQKVFSYIRRNTEFFQGASSGTKIKKQVNAQTALVKEQIATVKKQAGRAKRQERIAEKKQKEQAMREKAEAMKAAKKKQQEAAAAAVAEEEENITSNKQTTKKAAVEPQTEEMPEIEFLDDAKPEEVKDDEEDSDDNEPPPVGNGGTTDTYVWTQSLDDVEMRVEVPLTTRGKHCQVETNSTTCFVAVNHDPIIDGEWKDEIVEVMWTLETEDGKKYIVLSIEKYKKMCWWDCVIKGDPAINTKKIQPENSKLGDLDGETRQTVEKMMHDQRAKEMGLPTWKEQQQKDKLSNFMKMHPEMDFSKAKFGNQGFGNMGGGFGGNMGGGFGGNMGGGSGFQI